MFPIRVKACSESDLRMLGSLARNIQRVLPVTQADIDAAAALGKGWVVWKVIEVNDPIDNLRGGTQLVIKQNSITPGQNVRRVLIVSGPGGETVVIGPDPSPLLLPDAIANSLSYVKAFGGTKQGGVPSGYTLLNGVANGPNTYIDTGIIPNVDDIEIEIRVKPSTGSWYILQSRASTIWGISGSSSGSTILLGWAGTGNLLTSAITRDTTHIYYIKATMNNGTATLYVKDETANTEDTKTATYTSAVPSLPFWLYGNQNNDRVNSGNKVFMARIKVGGKVVMDYVPSLNPSNVVGFYDTATGVFKVSAAGTLVADQTLVPTPATPIDVWCNNGVLKYSPNELNPSDIEIGYYRVSGTGELTESPYNFITGYMPVKPGQSYVFFGRRQDDNRLSSYNRIHWFNANKEFISTNSYTKDTIGTGTAPSNAYFAQCSCNESGATSRVTTQEIVDGYNWVFQQGSAEVPYIPYVVEGGLYTDGTVETINIHTKNLSPNELDNVGYTSTGGTSSSSTFCGNLHKIKCVPGDKFTVSCGNFPDGISGVFINTWKTDGTWNQRQAIAMGSSYTYTIPAGVGEVNFTLYKTGGITIGDSSWLQVERGNTATTYQPYFDGGSAVTEMLLSVGTSTDEQEVISGAVTRKVGVLVLDGTENVGTSNATFTVAVSDRVSSKTPLICSHFQYSNKTSSQTEDLTVISFSSTNIGFRYDACANAAAFKTWLTDQYAAGTPVIVVYQLAAETTETVVGQPMETTDGDNIAEITQASMDGLELEVTYMKVA